MATGHDLAMRLRAAYLAMHRRTNAEFARLGLTADQFVVLTALVDGGSATQKELVRRTASDPNTMSEMLTRLEGRGLVLRTRHAEDGRARSVALTREGRRAQQRLWKASVPLREELERPFRPGEIDALVESLGRVVDTMTREDDKAPTGRTPPGARRRPTAKAGEG